MSRLNYDSDDEGDISAEEESVRLAYERADQYIALENRENRKRTGKYLKIYVEPARSLNEMINRLEVIFENLGNNAFKFNIQLAFILKNHSTGQMETYFASSNTQMFQAMVPVLRRNEIPEILNLIRDRYHSEEILDRPGSSYVLYGLAYFRCIVTRDSRPLKGGDRIKIPQFIKKSRYIYTEKSLASASKDMCIFFALAKHWMKSGLKSYTEQGAGLSGRAHCMKDAYCSALGISNYEGVVMEDMGSLESFFDIAISVYILTEKKKGEISINCIRFAEALYPKNGEVFLARVEDHILYISDIYKLCSQKTCPMCKNAIFGCKQNFYQHTKLCAKRIQRGDDVSLPGKPIRRAMYSTGGIRYKPRTSIFEDIEKELSIKLDSPHPLITHLVTFDAETLSVPIQDPEKIGSCSEITHELQPMCLAIASNIPGTPPVRVFWADEYETIGLWGRGIVNHFTYLSGQSKRVLEEKYSHIYDLLLEEAERRANANSYSQKKINDLIEAWNRYIQSLPCAGFNSSKFDNKLILQYILPPLIEAYGASRIRLLKKGTRFIRISVPDFYLFDILSYLPVSMSYSLFLYEILGVSEKSVMPYEYLKGWEVLKDNDLPPYHEWVNGLTGVNILDQAWLAYSKYRKRGFTHEAAMSALKLPPTAPPPLAGEERLEELRREYKEFGCRSLKEFCNRYVTLDVVPFLNAAEKMQQLYHRQYGFNLYRDSVSLPGFSVMVAFKEIAEIPVYIPCESTYKLLSETPGGPSIVFRMKAEAGSSKIRPYQYGLQGSRICQSIFSLDSSFMYGSCLADGFPYGPETIRKKENGFKAFFPDKRMRRYLEAERVLAFFAESNRCKMETYRNYQEFISRKSEKGYKVDGTWSETLESGEMVLKGIEYFGCAYHSHPKCTMFKFGDGSGAHPIRKPYTHMQVYQMDQDRLEILNKEFSDIFVVRSCEFNARFICSPEWEEFKERRKDLFADSLLYTESEILDLIYRGEIQGFVQCNVTCPDYLISYFKAFPVIFKRRQVGREDLGPFMQDLLQKHGLLKEPRIEMVSGNVGEQVVIGTNLLCWYMEKGFIIDNVNTVIEYLYSDRLKNFVLSAAIQRSQAKTNDEKILAASQKAIVNSLFGKMLQNNAKFTTSKICYESRILKYISNPNMISADFIGGDGGEDIYQVNYRPKKIHYNSPIQVGAAILNLAKLKVIEFYYDVIRAHLMESSFEPFLMATDSISFICSEPSMEAWFKNCVIKGKEESFQEYCKKYFPDPSVPASKYTPGIWKLEYTGTRCIALSAKSYVVENAVENVIKLSCRGLSHHYADHLTYDLFLNALEKSKTVTADVKSLEFIHNRMVRYQNTRQAIGTCGYIKRKILDGDTFCTDSID